MISSMLRLSLLEMFQTLSPAASTRFLMARKFSSVPRPFPVWTFRYSTPICLIQVRSSSVTSSSTCIEILMPGERGSNLPAFAWGAAAAAAAASREAFANSRRAMSDMDGSPFGWDQSITGGRLLRPRGLTYPRNPT